MLRVYLLTYLFCLLSSLIQAQSFYCEAKSNNPNNVWVDEIRVYEKNVTTGDDGEYGFNNSGLNLVKGECGNITLKFNNGIHKRYAIWIDYNKDFSFDPSERIFWGHGSNEGVGFNFDIPSTATVGTSRMRIVTTKFPDSVDACGDMASGEVEDHSVYIHDDDYYCSNKGLNTSYEWIDRLHLKSYTMDTGDNDGYYDGTCDPLMHVNPEGMYNLICYPGFSGSQYDERWKIFIDWNKDEDFNDPGEMIIDTTTDWKFYAPFTVPSSAEGIVRMRVSMGYPYSNYNAPCGNITYGEVEDYRLFVPNSSSSRVSSDQVENSNTIPKKMIDTNIDYHLTYSENMIRLRFDSQVPKRGDFLLFNFGGQLLQKNQAEQEVRFNILDSGVYIVVFQNEKYYKANKVIVP